MSELPSRTQEQDRGRFASPRDQVLYTMCQEAWGMESYRSNEGPYAWCAWVANSAVELDEIVDAFSEEIAKAGLADTSELVGNWVVVENSDQRVDVFAYENEDQARNSYGELEELIEFWQGEQL